MYYYKFNMPDWALATAHLSPEEEGVLLRLVNYCYTSEMIIPIETHLVFRRLRLSSAELSAVANQMLDEFFYKTESGFEIKKISEEVKAFQKNSKKNKLNGGKGGRPKKAVSCSDTESKPNGLIVGTEQKPNNNPNQEPRTSNQEPVTSNHKPTTKNKTDKTLVAAKAPKSKFNAAHITSQNLNGSAWVEWVEFRKGKRKPISKAAATKQLKILEAFSFEDQQAIIDQSITNDYQGLFPLKNKGASRNDQEDQQMDALIAAARANEQAMGGDGNFIPRQMEGGGEAGARGGLLGDVFSLGNDA